MDCYCYIIPLNLTILAIRNMGLTAICHRCQAQIQEKKEKRTV